MNQEGINLLTFKKKYVNQVVFIISYEQDKDIRKKQFDIEKAMESLVRATSVNTNLPDEFNPQMPRVTLIQGKKIVTFSQIAAQLIINIDNSKAKPLDTILSSVTNQINLFKKCLTTIVPVEKQSRCGVVVYIRYSLDSENNEQSCNHLLSNFFKVSSIGVQDGVPADVKFNIGYKVDDKLFISFIVERYQQFETKMDDINRLHINPNEFEPTECGVELKIDINNQPSIENSDKSDKTDFILEKAFNFVINESDNFMGL